MSVIIEVWGTVKQLERLRQLGIVPPDFRYRRWRPFFHNGEFMVGVGLEGVLAVRWLKRTLPELCCRRDLTWRLS